MNKMMSIALLPLVLFLAGQTGGTMIFVSNGGELGEWGLLETCPEGTVAKGFSLKVQPKQFIDDDTALNGICLYCVSCSAPHAFILINSTVGQWGEWTEVIWCPFGYLNKFSLRVEPPQEDNDDSAANNIQFRCSDGKYLEGHGLSFGRYGDWSDMCLYGISGIQTRVQKDQGHNDNTSLNDVRFHCKETSMDHEQDN